jgi:hypothetical protein
MVNQDVFMRAVNLPIVVIALLSPWKRDKVSIGLLW